MVHQLHHPLMSWFQSRRSYWANQAKQIRQRRDKLHEEQKQYLTPLYKALDKNLITHVLNSSAAQLAEQIQCGHYSSADVVLIYAYRACICGELINSNAEELFVEAHKYALEQDKLRAAERKRTNTPIGQKLAKYSRLLEGVPVSVKDQYQQRGCVSSCGVVSLATEDKRYKDDGVLLQLLREQGAILYVRTNVPQLLMFSETDSFWGECENAWKAGRSCGGSTGTYCSARYTTICCGNVLGADDAICITSGDLTKVNVC